ncbi:MAG: glycoside hydrolase family 38 C-terminal domain-containing protein [Armatimonadota bacterium]|nr:glycoside hydrolase family 38 C-terminal domain-containing protein [Armatimonadota bacterium]
MTPDERIDAVWQSVRYTDAQMRRWVERLQAQVEFARQLAQANPSHQAEWEELILSAVQHFAQAIAEGKSVVEAVQQAEATLSPLSPVAKQYTIHCVGHAHIDMNWMWNWPETVATTNDSFSTVDRLMQEFPQFRFSQDQASTYQMMKDYLPELWQKVQEHVRAGRWEVTASQWVEGDKNMASGEILCRHLLYTKRFFQKEFGLPYDAVQLDYEPDTFGHAHTVPGILARAGIRYYYFCRTGKGPFLFWWQGRDGSRVLAFDDHREWYLGPITPHIARHLIEFERATGLKDMLFVYGVGDHGGGPTRRDLQLAHEMMEWPVFPRVQFSTYHEFFRIAEREAKNLPVIDSELNFVFEGCYSSQSNIKYANRRSENALIEAEICALLARGVCGMEYPAEQLHTAWRHAMFNQFHDILPGSGVHATYEYAQGLFQEIIAHTSMIKTRSLRALAARVNTKAVSPAQVPPTQNHGEGLGGGQGDLPADGVVSRYGAGGIGSDPFVVFNPSPWRRTEVVTARIWDRDIETPYVAVRDDQGNLFRAQVLGRGHYWQHNYIEVAFPAKEVPPLGYRTYNVHRAVNAADGAGCTGDGKGTIENEFLRLTVEQQSGAIVSLIDKRTGLELVPPGERVALLEYLLEAPHAMTAWVLGQVQQYVPFTEGATLTFPHHGPYIASVQAHHRLRDSRLTLTISLTAGVPRVDFTLEVDWLERGSPEVGVPVLRVQFPIALDEPRCRMECPNGWVERSTVGYAQPSETFKHVGGTGIAMYPMDMPAQRWVDLSGKHCDTGKPVGVVLVNDRVYAHSVCGSTLGMTLLRSSYDPDPLPELGQHTFRFALIPFGEEWSPADSARAGYDFNLPLNVVSTDVHEGDLPPTQAFAEVLTPNVMLSGMKKAEDSDALILRLYEVEGQPTTARVRLGEVLARLGSPVVETDILEQPLSNSTARMEGDVLCVEIPPFGIATVRVG